MVVRGLNRTCVKTLRLIRVILLTIPAFLLIPCVLLFICAPIYVWRYVVSQLKKVFRPDLSKMIVTRSAVMAVDDWDGSRGGQPKCNLVLTMCFEGHLDYERIISDIDEKLLQKRVDVNNNGDWVYPECRQYYEKWMGFMFWKWEKDFDIRRHIRFYDESDPNRPITSKDLVRIEADLTGRPFFPKFSPWEVLLLPNYLPANHQGPTHKSALIYRLHHGIADGYSLLNLLLREICQLYEHQYALPARTERSMCRKVIDNLVFAIRSPYESVKQQVECRDYNEWRIPESKLSRIWFHAQTNPIPLDYIKEIKRGYNVSFTAVLVAALTGGIRNYLLKRGRPVSAMMHSLAPFPLADTVHTTKLRNFYTFAFLKFPVHLENPKVRMEVIHRHLNDMKTATTPLTNFWQIPIFGGLFACMIKPCANNYLSTSVMSNFPGPNEICQFLGNPVIEMGHTGGVVHGNTALGFAMLSYCGNLTIRARACKSVFPTEAHIEDLLHEVCLELEVLKKSIEV